MNKLYFGDNLDVLRAMPAEQIDLIYLDPPFNSNADYNLLYGTKRGGPSQAQSHAFEDTWKWGRDAQRALDETADRHLEAGIILDAFQKIFAGSNMMAYLAMMAVRLIELHRVLKPTGSIYLHCDPTASHYLKILLDAIFRPDNFLNEVIWKRTSAHSSSKRFGPVHDVLLYYGKGQEHQWNSLHQPYDQTYVDAFYTHRDSDGRRWRRSDLTGAGTRNGETGNAWHGIDVTAKGRHWAWPPKQLDAMDAAGRIHWPSKAAGMPMLKRYLDDQPGMPLQDVISDIPPMHNLAAERLGYPTQKPLALLERLIAASSNPIDVVMDPFCGCGTAIEAAQKLGRQWIGIDVTYLAVHVIEERLKKSFGSEIHKAYRVLGKPKDADDARALAARDWLEFQKWAVFVLGGLPKDRAGPDGGIDGVIRYHRVGIEQPNRAIVSVKGGLNVGVDAVHKLKSVVAREKAEIGVLICIESPTSAMRREAASCGEVGPPSRRAAKIQIITVDMLFDTHPVELPGMIDAPEIVRQSPPLAPRKKKKALEGQGELLLPITGDSPVLAVREEHPNRKIRELDIKVTRPLRGGRSKP